MAGSEQILSDVALKIYGAVVGTIALGWNIWTAIRTKRRKVGVTWGCFARLVQDTLSGSVRKVRPVLTIKMTNLGPSPVSVNRPFAQALRRLPDGNIFQLLTVTPGEQFPTELATGHVYEKTIDLHDFVEALSRSLQDNDYIRFAVADTLGKEHRSKKQRFGDLRKQCQAIVGGMEGV